MFGGLGGNDCFAMAFVQGLNFGYISVAAVTASYGFALTARHFFQTPKKYPKRLAPTYGPRRLGSLRCGIDPGAAATVCFAAPPSAVYDFVVRSLRSHPRINPSTQPPDVAGEARSKAGELTLGLVIAPLLCGSARDGFVSGGVF